VASIISRCTSATPGAPVTTTRPSAASSRSRARYAIVLRRGEIQIVLKSALHARAPAAEYVKRHGEGVHDVALAVEDLGAVFTSAVSHGATVVEPPSVVQDEHGSVVRAVLGTAGIFRHTLIQPLDYDGPFLPGFEAIAPSGPVPDLGLTAIDHVALGVAPGTLHAWTDFYRSALGFQVTHSEDVTTEQTAMNSFVVADPRGRVKFPMTEPRAGRRKSQVDEYLSFTDGPGAQHAALRTDDIITTVRRMQEAGMEFLRTPAAYYDALPARVGELDEDLAALRELNILVDRDATGYLLQIFTQPLDSRPTFFLEIIQRRGAVGFGSGNIRALFEAVEREQARRGNL
jgi:4-hydroxyphenylpyruvate dioxygenase